MPNWCENDLTIAGSENVLDVLAKTVTGETAFDFNKLVPMPPELEGIHTGFTLIDGVGYHNWRVIDGKDVGLSKEDLEALQQRVGARDWYDWSYLNWGTKWNTSDVQVDRPKPKKLVYHFDTAWSPPLPIIRALATRFPLTTCTLRYYEGGMCFKGLVRYKLGVLTDEMRGTYHGRRGG